MKGSLDTPRGLDAGGAGIENHWSRRIPNCAQSHGELFGFTPGFSDLTVRVETVSVAVFKKS